MLDERKTAILRAVVQEYIATAQPVGSTHVATAAGIKVSSATVRNEMAVLEQEGYLAQPHTSAGRVPTDKGYRFYVDHLAPQRTLDSASAARVGEFFDTAHVRLEELLHRTTNLLAQMTRHTAVVVGPAAERAQVRSVQIVGLGGRHATVVAVLSNGVVENQPIEWTDDVGEVRLAAATAHLQQHLIGRVLEHGTTLPSSGDQQVDAVCERAIGELTSAAAEQPVFLGGTAAMATAFDAVEVVREVLHTLEQQYVVVSLVRDVMQRGLSIAIGTEHGVEPLAACSVVVKPVVVDGEHVGTVGVLGPTRMNYPQALATVEVVGERLGRRLGDGGVHG